MGRGRKEGGPRGRDACIQMAGSRHCTAETNVIVKQLNSNKKNLKKNMRKNVPRT